MTSNFYLVDGSDGPLDDSQIFIATGRNTRGELFVAEYNGTLKKLEIISGKASHTLPNVESVEDASVWTDRILGKCATHYEVVMDEEAQL